MKKIIKEGDMISDLTHSMDMQIVDGEINNIPKEDNKSVEFTNTSNSEKSSEMYKGNITTTSTDPSKLDIIASDNDIEHRIKEVENNSKELNDKMNKIDDKIDQLFNILSNSNIATSANIINDK